MQNFIGAKPSIDTLCVENTKLRAVIKKLETKNSALAAEINKLSTQNNILKAIFGNALRSTKSKKYIGGKCTSQGPSKLLALS